MRNTQLPPLNLGSLNSRSSSTLRQTILGKYPQTERAALNPASFKSKYSNNNRLSIDLVRDTPRNRLQRTVKQSLRTERPLIQSKAIPEYYEFADSPSQSPTDLLMDKLKELQKRYKQLVNQNKEITHQIEHGNDHNGLPRITLNRVPKFTESKFLLKLQEYEKRKVAIAIKASDLESEIESLTLVANKYQQKIAYYENRFLAMKEDDKYRLVDNALNINRLSKFIKSKPLFKKYRMDSQSSIDF